VFPAAQLPPLRTPAEGHGSCGEDPAVRLGRPAALGSKGNAWPDNPKSILWRDSHRAKGISRRPAFERIRTVAPATDIRAHSQHRAWSVGKIRYI
jgi:hypothetical protein